MFQNSVVSLYNVRVSYCNKRIVKNKKKQKKNFKGGEGGGHVIYTKYVQFSQLISSDKS